MKLHELAKQLGKSNTDTKLFLQDLNINFDNDVVANDVAEKLIAKVNEGKQQPTINPSSVTEPRQEPRQDDPLTSARAINHQINSESEQALLEGFAVRGTTLANLASAVEANSFINQLSRNKAEFASLFLSSVNQELSLLMANAEGKLIAPTSPLEQLKGLQLNQSEQTRKLQPSNWLKSNQS